MSAGNQQQQPIGHVCLGVFLVAMATLMLEVALTRVFSVTMWYHFAFVAVSLAMFGLAAGGALNYALSDRIDPARTRRYLALGALLLAWCVPGAYLWHLGVPFVFRKSFPGMINVFLVYAGLAVPFVVSGFTISLALARYPRQVGTIYFSDLLGAGLACLAVVVLMHLMPAHQVIVCAGLIALAAAAAFRPAGSRRAPLWFSACALALLLLLNGRYGLLEPDFIKGEVRPAPEYSGWNSFSRVVVDQVGEPDTPLPPFGWGMSANCPYLESGRKLARIDSSAATPITRFNGDLSEHQYLAWDVTNLVHHVKHDADVLVIGVGGGRDLLSAMYFDQRSVTGVEINPLFAKISLQVYPDYSGALFSERYPGVRVVIDEGRSFLQKSGASYDIVQMSLVDTWAATAAGAFVLSENNLYTVEAFQDVYQRLKPGGIYSISRFTWEPPRQTLRVVCLARTMFQRLGLDDFERSIAVVNNANVADGPHGTSSVLIKRGQFSEQEIAAIEQTCDQMSFTPIYLPGRDNPPGPYVDLITVRDLDQFIADYPYDLTPSSDDSPFFFQMIKPVDVLRSGFGLRYRPYQSGTGQAFNYRAVFLLFALLLVSSILVLIFVFGPLWLKARRNAERITNRAGFLAYFCCLGLGFMLVEIPLLQRFILLMGHPVYSLTVILFSLLAFSGIGSALTTRMGANPRRALRFVLLGLAVLLALYIRLLPDLIYLCIHWSTPAKVVVVAASLLPVGLLLGMPFPLGITIMGERSAGLIPWVWGVNGAAGVLASVLAVAVALIAGFSVALTCGLACYLIALAVTLSFPKRP
ncbi:MAG: hypothetical protein P9M14_03295 [Candidatus Alcyoniella australis]|nr:hypothetical protein [Candidatus Alcyoniella australis]